MFAVIYRGFIFAGKEDEYRKNWNIIANYFIKERGALGSTLHQTDTGEYIAYSRWPDKMTRDLSWGNNDIMINKHIDESIKILKSCIDKSKPHDEICMDVLDDFILSQKNIS